MQTAAVGNTTELMHATIHVFQAIPAARPRPPAMTLPIKHAKSSENGFILVARFLELDNHTTTIIV